MIGITLLAHSEAGVYVQHRRRNIRGSFTGREDREETVGRLCRRGTLQGPLPCRLLGSMGAVYWVDEHLHHWSHQRPRARICVHEKLMHINCEALKNIRT